MHGFAYAFFFATVYIYVDENFPKDVRTSAQSLFNLLILGLGPLGATSSRPGSASIHRQRCTASRRSIINQRLPGTPGSGAGGHGDPGDLLPSQGERPSPRRGSRPCHLESSACMAAWLMPSLAGGCPSRRCRAAQEPMADDELARHLTTIRSQIENVTIDLARREELALEMAATLDRAAQSSPDSDVRRRRWSEAIELLDWFLKANPDPPRERQLRFQAAVLRWAQGTKLVETGLSWPATIPNRARGRRRARQCDRAVSLGGRRGQQPDPGRQPAVPAGGALADRADLEPAGSAGRRSRESEALDLLDQARGGNGPRRFLAPAQGRPVAPARESRPRPARDRRRRQARSPPRRRARSSRSTSRC